MCVTPDWLESQILCRRVPCFLCNEVNESLPGVSSCSHWAISPCCPADPIQAAHTSGGGCCSHCPVQKLFTGHQVSRGFLLLLICVVLANTSLVDELFPMWCLCRVFGRNQLVAVSWIYSAAEWSKLNTLWKYDVRNMWSKTKMFLQGDLDFLSPHWTSYLWTCENGSEPFIHQYYVFVSNFILL